MTYTVALGDPSYSSWSLRGWLLFARFNIPFTARFAPLGSAAFSEMMQEFAPARKVPAVNFGDVIIGDSLAIAEELASRHPDAGLWPDNPQHRAIARSLAAEMHSGFLPLRRGYPMDLREAFAARPVDEDVAAELRRLEYIWDHARAACNSEGPWLCGAYCAADAFFAPVAARIAGFGLKVSDSAAAYVTAHLNDPAFQDWRRIALADGPARPEFSRDLPRRPWPVSAAEHP
ncbi:glutathione S-transferase [Pararhodobacter oceanensis]|uniref:glutathione S-transferase n=1 Tax=Pararhodobacter oceanensis TaxID=2172121 RepID=UPI003A90E780